MYKNTLSDPFSTKLTLEEARAEYDKTFEERWRCVLKDFQSTAEDAMHICGPSSYLFTLAGEKIAVDPQIRRKSDFALVEDTIKEYFGSLSAILITHEHDDHFCTPLARLLKDTDVIYYLPHDMHQKWIDESELPPERIRFVRPGDVFKIGGVTVKAFHTPHRPFGADWELPERGYELSTEKGRVLLPGDIREYAYTDYPKELYGADLCIAHVWAGNDSIHPEEYLPKMEKAADLFSLFAAKKYFLAHLYEIGRAQNVMWDTEHANLLAGMLKERLPQCEASAPLLCHGYRLFDCEEI
jgi:L-ascorbate metabolism protein UlaG (beta-lactamase superfamily)